MSGQVTMGKWSLRGAAETSRFHRFHTTVSNNALVEGRCDGGRRADEAVSCCIVVLARTPG